MPHTEVDLILVNGVSVGFDYRLQAGDRVSVYPVFESLDVGPVNETRTARANPDPLLGREKKIWYHGTLRSVYLDYVADTISAPSLRSGPSQFVRGSARACGCPTILTWPDAVAKLV